MSFTINPTYLEPMFDWVKSVSELGLIDTNSMERDLQKFTKIHFTSQEGAQAELTKIQLSWDQVMRSADMYDGTLSSRVATVARNLLENYGQYKSDSKGVCFSPTISRPSTRPLSLMPTSPTKNDELSVEILNTLKVIVSLQEEEIPTDPELHALRLQHCQRYLLDLKTLEKQRKESMGEAAIPYSKDFPLDGFQLDSEEPPTSYAFNSLLLPHPRTLAAKDPNISATARPQTPFPIQEIHFSDENIDPSKMAPRPHCEESAAFP